MYSTTIANILFLLSVYIVTRAVARQTNNFLDRRFFQPQNSIFLQGNRNRHGEQSNRFLLLSSQTNGCFLQD